MRWATVITVATPVVVPVMTSIVVSIMTPVVIAVFVPANFFAVISPVIRHPVTEFLASITRIRTLARALSAARISRCAGIGRHIRVRFARLVVAARVGQVIRAAIFRLSRLFGFGRRNLANDLAWIGCIRIEDAHRDLQLITSGGCVREHRGDDEYKNPGKDQLPRWRDRLTTAHATPSYSESL
jgi:hypothetical protein